MHVIDFPGPNLRDVPKCLRMLADRIEHGEEAELEHAIIVGQAVSKSIKFYSYGDSYTYAQELGLLHLAQAILTDMCLKGDDDEE